MKPKRLKLSKEPTSLKRITLMLVLAILYITPFVFIPIGLYNDYFYAPKLFFYQGIVSLFLIIILWYRKKIISSVSLDRIDALLVLFIISLTVATLLALDVRVAMLGNPRRVEGLATLLTYVILFMMARNMVPLKQKHVNVLLALSLIIVLYGVLQTFGIDPFPRDFIRTNWTRAFSTIGNPNFLGSFIVLLLPFTFDLYMRKQNKFGLLAYAILLYGLLATMTRGTWIGAFFAVLIYLGILWYQKQLYGSRFLVFIVVSIMVLLVYGFVSGDAFIARLLSLQTDLSKLIENEAIEEVGSSRMFIWMRGMQLFYKRPWFGYGPENVGLAFIKYFRSDLINKYGMLIVPDKAHNEYLHYALTGGIFTLLTYLGFIVLIIKKNMQIMFKHPLALPLFIAIVGYLIQAFFNISVVSVAYIFWIFLGWSVNHCFFKDLPSSDS